MTQAETVRVAAVADIHVRDNVEDDHRNLLREISAEADVLLLCGDLTNRGLPAEAEILADSLSACKIPVLGVLGNHDYECGQQEEVKRIVARGGMRVLDREPFELGRVGFAGSKGFAGGFERHMLEPWGEQIIKSFVREAIDEALCLEEGLARLRTERKIAVLHYAPIRDTVVGEPPEIYAYLGSSRLAEPIDRFGVAAAFHGHAHRGTPLGKTAGGVPVYNVALPLMRQMSPDKPYVIFEV